ncbi:MAG: HAD family hydrolase [Oscillospiraceae bacterium]|nr:HAD family hydrolase [Oscillospiraceae bacterium]
MKAKDAIIFSDMDGTLLSDWSLGPYVPAANLEAIKRFISEGGLFSIASGRQFRDTVEFLGGIKFSVPMVQDNGSVLYDSINDVVLEKIPFPEAAKLECLEYSRRNRGVRLIAADEDKLYQVVVGGASGEPLLRDLTRTPISEEQYLSLESVKVCFVVLDEADVPSVYSDIIKFKCSDKLVLMQSSPVFLEMLDKNAGKAAGIKKAVVRAGAEGRKLICIGDYDNDCDMLKLADISACPFNSSPRVLEMADIVTCGNNEGAIADLINRLGEL